MKTFISPHSWFAFEYPDSWFEFEGEPGDFLFYDPDEWKGNFRIQAWRDKDKLYGRQCVAEELRKKHTEEKQLGSWRVAQTKEHFTEEGEEYVNYYWLAGFENTCVECSFTIPAGSSPELGEKMVASLRINSLGVFFKDKLIPIRLAEMMEIDDAYIQMERVAKKACKTQFKDFQQSIEVLQKLVDEKELNQLGPDANVLLGMTVCALLAENVEGLEWNTYINNQEEKPVLVREGAVVADPRALFRSLSAPVDILSVVDDIVSAKE